MIYVREAKKWNRQVKTTKLLSICIFETFLHEDYMEKLDRNLSWSTKFDTINQILAAQVTMI